MMKWSVLLYVLALASQIVLLCVELANHRYWAAALWFALIVGSVIERAMKDKNE